MSRPLRVLFVVHGVVTITAAIVLAIFPTLIPATVGISLGVEDYLLSYFLSAAELGIGLLSLGAVRLRDAAAVRLIAGVFAVFHLSTAALEVVYLVQTAVTPVLIANVVVRLLAAGLFLVAGRRGLDPAAARTHPRG